MTNPFTKHPSTVGETYVQHMRSGFAFGFEMIVCGLACVLHGVIPVFFKKTGSDAIRRLNEKMITDRSRKLVK